VQREAAHGNTTVIATLSSLPSGYCSKFRWLIRFVCTSKKLAALEARYET